MSRSHQFAAPWSNSLRFMTLFGIAVLLVVAGVGLFEITGLWAVQLSMVGLPVAILFVSRAVGTGIGPWLIDCCSGLPVEWDLTNSGGAGVGGEGHGRDLTAWRTRAPTSGGRWPGRREIAARK